ncbi:hypothetical protein [Ramlibacter tataouinensis]|uniref:Uncharacterized protein n=1 Tax=Ramlibacter tataouinensis (strain ATCC BAA-407 / DSM 14655 / LMG 21543 / TTB310) TaxID=365046 RepID=F5XXW3_RAMTT|nr:hypothetical protein [Ramlibacter tataouinensis]AEG93098.1 hypothetical protein Rta_20060 [Ramlibacter tataouinensis TTB310]
MHVTEQQGICPATGWAAAAGEAVPPRTKMMSDGARKTLRFQVMRTADERSALAGLRQHAALTVEQDLGLELAPFESRRDEIGIVGAIFLEERLVATIRFVPTGYGMTGAERLPGDLIPDKNILRPGSWEVGRLIMQPGDRHPELLARCLTLALQELIRLHEVRCFHGTTTLPMARLWRRFGMRTALTAIGSSGKPYALLFGKVSDVAAALSVLESARAAPGDICYSAPALRRMA